VSQTSSQQQLQQMYASQKAMQKQLQALLAHRQLPHHLSSHPFRPHPIPPPQLTLLLPPQGPSPGIHQVPLGPVSLQGVSISPPLVDNPPSRSLASYFPDVKPVLLVITKHKLNLGKLFKVDPQLQNRPKDTHPSDPSMNPSTFTSTSS